MDATLEDTEPVRGVKRKYTRKAVGAPVDDAAQAYAMRIWEGQSPDVPTAERVSRVMAGLTAQGLSTDVSLPGVNP